MSERKMSQEPVKIIPSNFKDHEFQATVGNLTINVHITKMQDSFYLWIGKFPEDEMHDLSLALPSRFETIPTVTKIIGSVEDTTSMNLAKRWTKKFGKPVYVSFNIPVDNLSLPGIEKRLHEELQLRTDLFF